MERRSGSALETRLRREFGETGFAIVPGAVPVELCRAARERIEERRAESPPPAGHRGHHSYWSQPDEPDPLRDLLGPAAIDAAGSLVEPLALEPPGLVQVALCIPPWSHHPGGPHLDGGTPPEPDGRPGTFTLLAGVLLTDQSSEDMGNLWVWPGTHRTNAAYLCEHGSDALLETAPYPPTPLPSPRQVLGNAGDVLLAHYLLGHNIGGNTSPVTREVVYFRMRAEGHRDRWRKCVQDAFHEFAPLRATLGR